MKAISAPYQAHLDTGSTSLAHAIAIRRADGVQIGFTSHDEPLTLDLTPWPAFTPGALAFDAKQGLDASTLASSAGLAVGNLEITTLDDGTIFERDDILAGRWRNARFLIFRYRWDVTAPTIAGDVEPLIAGTFGEVTLNLNTFRIELRDLLQLAQQSVGHYGSKTCTVRLGSVGLGKCNKDITAFTHNLTVTSVTDKRTFAASADAHAEDYFGEGIVTFTSGANAGLSQKVRTHATGGTFTLVLPMVLPISVGDTFTAIAGCRRRRDEDCHDKFGNVINFQGEPDRPLVDELTNRPLGS